MEKLASLKERIERIHRLTVRPNEKRFDLIKKRDELHKHHFFGNEEEEVEGKYQDPFGAYYSLQLASSIYHSSGTSN